MNPPAQVIPAYAPKDVFKFAIQWWLFLFITFLLPLDLLYRVKSLLEGMAWWQLILSTSSLVIFFASIALGIAVISTMLAKILLYLTRAGGKLTAEINVLLGCWSLATILLGYFWKWLLKVFDLPWTWGIDPKIGLVIALVAFLLVAANFFYDRLTLVGEIRKLAAIFFKFNAAVLLLAGLIGSGNIVYTQVTRHQAQKPGPLQAGKTNPGQPNIILITFDGLAAGHCSFHGYTRETTPYLKKFARESYVFDRMFASTNFTPSALASLLTGKHPFHHGIHNDYSYFTGPARNENLAALLRQRGYATLAVCAVQFGVPWNRNMEGFQRVSRAFTNSRGYGILSQYFFETGLGSASWLAPLYRENPLHLAEKGLKEIRQGRGHTPGDTRNVLGAFAEPEHTLAEAAAFLKAAKEPVFLWVHLLPPHDPYNPRKDFLYTFLKDKVFLGNDAMTAEVAPDGRYPPKDQPLVDKLACRYDELILHADHEVGKFLEGLRRSGLLDRSLLLVSSDHGEMFEKGFLSHCGPYLYQPLVHVPLLLRLPGQTQGRRLAAPVSAVDIPPTILDLLGVETPAWMDGRSVKGALTNPHLDTGAKFTMNLSYWGAPPDFHTKSIAAIKGNYKLIYYLDFQKYELYDFINDPKEEHNLLDQEKEVFLDLKGELDRLLGRWHPPK
jgi:arylsulfatase A-like enzyme